jgi:hypothetical protein
LKEHVDANHVLIIKRFEEEVNGPIKGTLERQLANKKPKV